MSVSLTLLTASMSMSVVCAWASTAAEIASMGLMLSVVSILMGLEEFHSHLYVDDDLATLLHTGGCQERILVTLRSEVGAAEQGLDSLEAIDVTAVVSGCGFFRTGFGLHSELHQEFFEVADGEGGDGCCVFDNHFSDD